MRKALILFVILLSTPLLMPPANAAVVYPLTPIGTLVTVA